jgi:hypothetical protein
MDNGPREQFYAFYPQQKHAYDCLVDMKVIALFVLYLICLQ